MTDMKLITGVAAITKAIVANAHVGQTYQKQLHVIACSVMQHFAKHKDIRLVKLFIDNQTESTRINALKAWFEDFSPVKFDELAEHGCVFFPATKVRLAAAMEKPFWKHVPEKPYVPVDALLLVEGLMKKLTADAAKTGRSHAPVLKALAEAKRIVDTPLGPVTAPVTEEETA